MPSPFACSLAPNNSCISPTGFDPNISTWGQTANPLGNCTNYVAYRLARNGAVQLAGVGNANTWKTRVQSQFGAAAANSTPAAGSVAWWDKSTLRPEGHVAYVEQVSGSTIYLTESHYAKGSARKVLTLGQAGWPNGFLHIKDAPVVRPAQPTNPSVTSTTGTTAVLTWTDASTNEDDFRTQYRIGTGAWVAGPSAAANATSVTVPGLRAGTAYTFQVGARNSAGTRWSAFAYGTTGAALAASPGDIIRHPDGDAYVLSGTPTALLRHWIPSPADFTCARAEANRRVVAVTRAQVDGVARGADRPGGNCLVRGPAGDVHFVNNAGRREWVPDSPTYDCEVGRGVRLLGVSAEFVAGVGEDGWHYCLNQANLHGKVLRHSDGDASYIHPDNSRTWIPDGPTFQCRLNQGKAVVDTRWREYVTSFRDAGWDYCYDVNALKNKIISHPDGDSHFVDGRGVRHWIKDAATYNCLIARGIPADTARWRQYITNTPEGEWAVCGDTLTTGQKLDRGQWLRSSDGRYTLHMQTDGNLVVYNAAHTAIWATNRLGSFATVQSDGNFVEYGAGALWATNTAGSGANRLVMQSDGNLVLYAGTRAVWSSNTAGR